LAALWGGGAVARRETPYFSEATRLFFLSPHLLNSEQAGRLTQPYREHVWVYACINAIAQSISSVPLLFKTGSRKDPQVVDSHPLIDLFEAPNPMMSGSQLLEATLVYLGLTGEAFYILDRRSEREIPREMWVVHPSRFQEVVDDKTGLISGWIYRKSTRQIPLQPYEVIFFRYFNPYNDYRGLSPLQAARAGVEQDYWAGRYNLAFFQNSAQPGGVLETSGNLTDEEYQRILAQWQDRHAGASKAHAIALLEGGLTYKQTGLSQKDMDFLEQRKWNREEIMAAFKVPKTELGLYEDVNYASSKTQRKLFWETTLFPRWPSSSMCCGANFCALLREAASGRNLIIPVSMPFRKTAGNWWSQPRSSGLWESPSMWSMNISALGSPKYPEAKWDTCLSTWPRWGRLPRRLRRPS
jgi:HK97 family phage portal protein